MTEPNTYPSLEAFYAADERRRRSGEADFGIWWTDGAPWPRFRVSYVRATGEVYALMQGNGGTVEVLGIVPPDEDVPEGLYYRTLDRILAGWADQRPPRLSWMRDRLANMPVTSKGDPQ